MTRGAFRTLWAAAAVSNVGTWDARHRGRLDDGDTDAAPSPLIASPAARIDGGFGGCPLVPWPVLWYE
jgi:hypothetical protein